MNFKDIFENYQQNRKLRKMQYIIDQQGIMNRYAREKENWENHIQESKKFILKSAETKQKGKAVVLGSGWLIDLPLEDLARSFNEVVLIDIVHPGSVKRKIKKFNNVSLYHEDITGGLVDYFYSLLKEFKSKKQKAILPDLNAFTFSLPQHTDFVISVNIMCQLHIILIDYIKTFMLYADKELVELAKIIQLSHIKMLPKNKSCLITDIEEEILDTKDQIIGVNPLIQVDLPKGNFSQKWKWKFDSFMTYREDFKTYFNTQAIDF